MATHVTSELVFLKRDPKHETEKPYKLQYDPGEDLPRKNCVDEVTDGIVIHDFRGREKDFTLDWQGFCVVELETQLAPEDFDDDAKVKQVYYAELKMMLKKELGARRVEVLEHGIRKRHVAFPVSTGKDYEFLQPTSVVHVDYTPWASEDASERALGIKFGDYQRVQVVNIWKPLRGPVTDWPLALCDAQTVDMDRDCIGTDVVMRDGFTENYQVYCQPEHKWYYLNKQLPSEAIIFRQTDTDERFATGVPHAGFHNPMAAPNERPRESVEARAFVYY